jgi:AcrR family transcriptional regulator
MAKSNPPKRLRRAYHSHARERSAEETRQRILSASRELFASQGYAGTTLEAIAEKAQVSPKTVTAVLGSKRAILGAVVHPTAFPPEVQKMVEESLVARDAIRRVRLVVKIARQVYELLGKELDLLRTAPGVAPELTGLAAEIASRRRGIQGELVVFLDKQNMLRRGVSVEEAKDVLSTLAGFDVYHSLVVDHHWIGDRYEAWLTQTLIQQLFQHGARHPARGPKTAKEK